MGAYKKKNKKIHRKIRLTFCFVKKKWEKREKTKKMGAKRKKKKGGGRKRKTQEEKDRRQ